MPGSSSAPGSSTPPNAPPSRRASPLSRRISLRAASRPPNRTRTCTVFSSGASASASVRSAASSGPDARATTRPRTTSSSISATRRAGSASACSISPTRSSHRPASISVRSPRASPICSRHSRSSSRISSCQTLVRDVDRLRDWDRRHARSPLGAAALAGSAIAVHPELSAAELGYDGPAENSLDAVGSRDHVAEFVFVAAMHAVHVSRLAEEIFLWSSRQFGWVALDDAFATGSSIMPQKKNADIAELARGRAARLIGSLAAMLAALKGLPFAYNRDLIEDKKAAFEAVDTLALVLPAVSGMVRPMCVNVDVLARQASEGFTLATEVADWLARKGVPFSEAHEITGALVRRCEDKDIGLADASDADLAAIDPRLDGGLRRHLTPQAAVAARSGHGGTAPDRVREQMARLRGVVDEQRRWAAAYDGPRG